MTDYNETFLGDLSDDPNNPTSHEFFPGELVLFAGSNVVTGSTIGGGNPPGDRDFFTFEVPTGFTVSAIVLNAYQWGDGNQNVPAYGDSYFALTQGSSFPSLTDASPFLVSKLIDDYVTGGSEIGLDLLEPTVGVSSPAGKEGPGQLDPGVYSVWYQETGANTTYEFDIVLTPPVGANFGTIQFSPSDIQVNEGAGTFDITLTRTGGSDGGVSVVLRRTGGSAENLVDFSFQPVTAIFKNGETQKVFSYPIIDDALLEENETATFELTSPLGGVSLGTARTSTLTIVDNDQPLNFGTSQFNSNAVQVNEAAGTVDLTLTRTGGSDGAVSVVLSQTGGTAQSPSDLTFSPVTVNFGNGQAQQVVSVPIVNDSLVEGNETAIFALTDPTGGASLGTTTTSTLTITDNDQVIVSRGTNRSDRVVGGIENDSIFGLRGNDRLIGGDGNDRLFGGPGDDRLVGGNGNDFLNGGRGEDIVIGGEGSDNFVLRRRNGSDLIRDFQIDEDSLILQGNLRFEQLTITQNGNRAVISVGNDQLAVLRGDQAIQLTAAQFS